MPRSGDVIDISGHRFLLEDGIGAHGEGARGGFGMVFAAREIDPLGNPIGADVAIKLVDRAKMEEHRRTHEDGTRSARKRFVESLEREIDALRRLQAHYGTLRAVNIVGFVHGGTMSFADDPGRPYPALVMERLGLSLDHIWAAEQGAGAATRRQLMTREGMLGLLSDIATGLNAVAAIADTDETMVHRDIKPLNILEKDGRFRLIDFGNIKAFQENTFSVGGLTPNYVAPELWEAIRRQESRSAEAVAVSPKKADIYSLGMTILKILTGRIPWRQQARQLSTHEDLLDAGDRTRLHDAIVALPGISEVEDGCTIVPWRRPDPTDLTRFQKEFEGLVLEMVGINPDGRPSPAEVMAWVQHLRAFLMDRPVLPKGRHQVSKPANTTAPIPPVIALPMPVRPLRSGTMSASWIAGTVAVAAAVALVSASASALITPRPSMTLEPISPLAVPEPARWSGRPDDYAAPLCGSVADRSIASGEHVVIGLSIQAPLLLLSVPNPTINIHASSAGRPGTCISIDRASGQWKCVVATEGLLGGARVIVSTDGADRTLEWPITIRPSGTRCTPHGEENTDGTASLPTVAHVLS